MLTPSRPGTKTSLHPSPSRPRAGDILVWSASPMTQNRAEATTTEHLMGVYNRAPLAFDHGKGCRLWSTEGDVYLDCVAGISTDALGHAHPVLVEALERQGNKLWHVSNIFRIPDQEKLADQLCAATFADVV